MRIGLIDDNPAILDFITTVLAMKGHTVSNFLDGASLLQMLRVESEGRATLPYDLLIVDFWLARNISGLDIVIILRQTPGTEHLPVLLISGAGEAALEPVNAQVPDLPILRKPFTVDALFTAIEHAVWH